MMRWHGDGMDEMEWRCSRSLDMEQASTLKIIARISIECVLLVRRADTQVVEPGFSQ